MPIWFQAFFWAITCVSDVQMNNASPFQISMFQELFNDMRNSSRHLVLTHVIALWRFKSPPGFHLSSGSCLGSVKVHSLTFSYTPENMRCDSWASSWLATLQPFCLGHKPKAKVVTSSLDYGVDISCIFFLSIDFQELFA